MCSELHFVRSKTIELARVFQDDNPVLAENAFSQQRVCKRRFARRRATGDEDIFANFDRVTKSSCEGRGKGALLDVIT